jgi:hypothetical protein
MRTRDHIKTAAILLGIITIVLCLSIQPAIAGKVLVDNNTEKDAYAARVTMLGLLGQPKDFYVCANPGVEHEIVDATGTVTKIVVLKPAKCAEASTDAVTGPVVKEYTVTGTPEVKRTFTVRINPPSNIQITEP